MKNLTRTDFFPKRKKKRPIEAWAPFTLGRRICIGFSFGLAEIKTVAVELLREFEFTINEKAGPTKRFPSFITRPENMSIIAKKATVI